MEQIIPIGHQNLTKADINCLLEHGNIWVEQGLAGACVPAVTDDGDPVVALLDPTNEQLLFGFGKQYGWYFVIDNEGTAIAEGQFIQDILRVLS